VAAEDVVRAREGTADLERQVRVGIHAYDRRDRGGTPGAVECRLLAEGLLQGLGGVGEASHARLQREDAVVSD